MKNNNINLMIILMSVAVLAVFWKVGTFDFLCIDDYEYILENPHVNTGVSLENIGYVLTNSWAANFHPLTFISHMADVELFGFNPGAHHRVNLFIHLANTILLLFVLFKMTGAFGRSLFVSLLFAFHPMHVESVAWISERKDVLCTFFFLMTILFYLKKIENNTFKNRSMVLLMLSFGLLSKPMVITLPFVLILIDYWPLKRFRFDKKSGWMIIREKLLYFALITGSSVITFISQKNYGAMTSADIYPLGVRISNAILSYLAYIKKLFYPVNLSIIYPLQDSHEIESVLLSFLFLVILTVLFIRMRQDKPYLIFGWLWFAGTLVPVIGIIQVGSQSMADRYSYISYIGLFIMLSWGSYDLFRNFGIKDRLTYFLSGSAVMGCIILTWFQLDHFQNSVTLFSHAVKVTENNYIAHYNLGVGYLNEGNPSESIRQCTEAIRIKKKIPVAYNCLGRAYAEKGQFAKAAECFSQAIAINDKYARARYNLGNAYARLGRINDAIVQFKKVYENKPDYFDVYSDYALLLVRSGQMEAAAVFLRTLKLTELILTDISPVTDEPEENRSGKTLFNKGLQHAEKGETAEATTFFNEVLSTGFFPRELFNNFGVVNVMQNRLSNSVKYFQEAIRIDPEFSDAFNNWGTMLLHAGKIKDALPLLEKAVQLKKNSVYFNNLGLLYIGEGELDKAMKCHMESYSIDPSNKTACYLIASIFSLKGEEASAEKWLKQSITHGFSDMMFLENDIFFTPMKKNAYYLEKIQASKHLKEKQGGL